MADRDVAKQLYAQLQEILKTVAKQIDSADEDGPVLKITTEGLAKAIAALQTTIR